VIDSLDIPAWPKGTRYLTPIIFRVHVLAKEARSYPLTAFPPMDCSFLVLVFSLRKVSIHPCAREVRNENLKSKSLPPCLFFTRGSGERFVFFASVGDSFFYVSVLEGLPFFLLTLPVTSGSVLRNTLAGSLPTFFRRLSLFP